MSVARGNIKNKKNLHIAFPEAVVNDQLIKQHQESPVLKKKSEDARNFLSKFKFS